MILLTVFISFACNVFLSKHALYSKLLEMFCNKQVKRIDCALSGLHSRKRGSFLEPNGSVFTPIQFLSSFFKVTSFIILFLMTKITLLADLSLEKNM